MENTLTNNNNVPAALIAAKEVFEQIGETLTIMNGLLIEHEKTIIELTARVKELESQNSNVLTDKSVEELIDDKIASAIEEHCDDKDHLDRYDIEEIAEEAAKDSCDSDFEDKVINVIDEYDFSERVENIVEDMDFGDAIENTVARVIGDVDLQPQVNKALQNVLSNILSYNKD